MITVNGSAFDFRESETLEALLARIGEKGNALTLLLLDGEVLHYEESRHRVVEAGAVIQVMQIISGG